MSGQPVHITSLPTQPVRRTGKKTAAGAGFPTAPPAMPTALDDPAFLARLQAEAHATAARIAAATRARALKAAEERRASELGERVAKQKS